MSDAVGLGYLRLPTTSAQAGGHDGVSLVAAGIAGMETFADAGGYRLGEVFVDDHPLRQLGWTSLMDAVRVMRPVAVLVPDIDGLRLSGVEVEVLRVRLRRVTNAPLIVARPASGLAAPPRSWQDTIVGTAGTPIPVAATTAMRAMTAAGRVTARRAQDRRVGRGWARWWR